MRFFGFVLALVVTAAPLAAAAAVPLRHVEYTVTTEVDGRSSRSHLAVDLVGTTADRGISLEIGQPDQGEPVRVDVDKHGIATVASDVPLTREAALLVYFFALGAQNMTGLDRGDEWGGTDGTRFRVVRKPAEGRLDIAFTRAVAVLGEHADYRGRLLYDAFKVVPLSFDARGDVRESDDAAAPARRVRLALTLTKDSQP